MTFTSRVQYGRERAHLLIEGLSRVGVEPERNGNGWHGACPVCQEPETLGILSAASGGFLRLHCGCDHDQVIGRIDPDGALGLLDEQENDEVIWPDPLPLTSPPPPAFPLEILPPVVCEFVTALAAQTETPLDLAAMTALGVLSAAIGGRVEIEVDWREPVVLYLATVLPSGEGKSPVVKQATAALLELESQEIERSRERVTRGQAMYRVAQKRLANAETAAAKATGLDRHVAESEMEAIAAELAGMTTQSSRGSLWATRLPKRWSHCSPSRAGWR